MLLFLLVASTAFAQSSARFATTRSVVAGGGTTFSTSSRYQMAGTIAQPLAAAPGGARYSIQGGFWIRPAPIFFAPTRAGTNFLVSLQSEPGKTYTVQSRTALGSGWQTVATVPGTGGVLTVTNPASGAQGYYRLVEQ